MYDDMYNVKYRQLGALYELLLFETLKQRGFSHVVLKVTNFIVFGLYLKLFNSLQNIWIIGRSTDEYSEKS